MSADPGPSWLDDLPDGVVQAGPDQVVVRANAPARRLLGQDPVGRPLREAIPLQDTEGCDWYATNTPYDGLSTRVAIPEQSWLNPAGQEVLVTTRMRRDRGTVATVSLVIRSGRGRSRLDRERSDLVATVAHELRSPLTGVRGFVGTLLNRWDRFNDEQKKLMLTTVHSDAERLSRLITELLDVARIDTGRLPLYPRSIDAVASIDQRVEAARTGTPRAIETSYDPATPEVYADPDKFAQVIVNLVDNALRHGDGTVRVSTIAMTDPFDGVCIEVTDEGQGIPEALRKRVFTKFWKYGVSGGSGLGMYIINGLVRAHGGVIEIGDAAGGGARVVLRWPSGEPA